MEVDVALIGFAARDSVLSGGKLSSPLLPGHQHNVAWA